jgi:uncharacterized protein YbaP (TraB family)
MQSKKSFLLIICVLTLLFPKTTNAQLEKSLLWKISGKNFKHPSYLYGTIHIKDKRAFEFGDSVFVKIDQCKSFVMEIKLDELSKSKLQSAFLAPKGQTLHKFFTPSEYKLASKVFEESTGNSLKKLDVIKPAWVPLLIINSKISKDMNETVDEYLYGYAKNKSYKIDELESIDDQIALFDKIDKKVIMDFLNQSDKYDSLTQNMIEAYQAQDIEKLYEIALSNKNFAELDNAFFKDRNYKMVDVIEKLGNSHNVFIAVGAGHLAGDDGLIKILRRNGYTVTPIFSAKAPAPSLDSQWETVISKDHTFQFKSPGKFTEKEQFTKTAVGNIKSITYSYEPKGTNDPNIMYAVVYADYPLKSGISSDSKDIKLQDRYKNMIDGAAKSTLGKVKSTSVATIAGHEGMKGQISMFGGKYINNVSVVMVKNRSFIIQVISTAENKNNKTAETFINSFELLK